MGFCKEGSSFDVGRSEFSFGPADKLQDSQDNQDGHTCAYPNIKNPDIKSLVMLG